MDSTYIFLAKYLAFSLPLLLLYVLWKKTSNDRLRLIMLIGISSVISVVIAKVAEKLYFHPRPFMVSDIKPLVSHAADNGFPSEHATYAMTLASTILVANKKIGYWALGIALLVGTGRVLVHVHSPIDIVGGFLVGITAVWVGKIVTDKYFPRFQKLYDNANKHN